jgi:hypothetical protein
MRQAKVLDAKQLLNEALAAVSNASQEQQVVENSQLVANVATTMASMFLSHPNIAQDTLHMVDNALVLTQGSGDIITRLRTLRVFRKLISRTSPDDLNQLGCIDREKEDAEQQLHMRQSCAPMTLHS